MQSSEYILNEKDLISKIEIIYYKRRNYYYCSEFVRDVLTDYDIVDGSFFSSIVKPMDFISLPCAKMVYKGLLHKYLK